MTSLRLVLCLCVSLLVLGCQEPYRVGEFVWVEWEKGKNYPAYIVAKKPRGRYRVHFDGYETRWDTDVSLDRIKGRIDIDSPVTAPPPPKRVARLLGLMPATSSSAKTPMSPYKIDDRVRVRWRGSVYAATVVEVIGADSCKVHYEGHESAWDEVVDHGRIVGRR